MGFFTNLFSSISTESTEGKLMKERYENIKYIEKYLKDNNLYTARDERNFKYYLSKCCGGNTYHDSLSAYFYFESEYMKYLYLLENKEEIKNSKPVENKTRAYYNPNTYVVKETKHESKNTKNYTEVKATTKSIGTDWLKDANDFVKNETCSKVKLTEDDIKITAVEKECDLIILNYILKRFKENEKELIFKKLLIIFPYIYEEYENIKIELERYNNFKFQDKVTKRADGTKKMRLSFKKAFTRRIYTIYGLLNNNSEDFTEREFKILEKILDDLDTNIKIYK